MIGLEFERPAVEALAPDAVRPDDRPSIWTSLARKHFIDLPSTSQTRDAIYRFHHHLVRDTVYNGLLKRARANLHLAFVRWADKINAERDRALEFEEILGYHLEQAYRYLGELGPLDEAGVAIGIDAAQRLANAASAPSRAATCMRPPTCSGAPSRCWPATMPERAELLPQFAETLMGLGDYASARAAVKEAAECGERLANARIKASSEIVGMLIRLHSGEPGEWSEQTLSTAHALIPALERELAHSELAMTWRLIVRVHGIAGRYSLVSDAAGRSIKHARLAGNPWLAEINGVTLAHVLLLGPTPVPQAIAECEALLAEGLKRPADRVPDHVYAGAAEGHERRAVGSARLCRRSRARLRDLGQGVFAASTGLDLLLVELHGGDLALAEREVRDDFDFLTRVGETYTLSTMAALLVARRARPGPGRRGADAVAHGRRSVSGRRPGLASRCGALSARPSLRERAESALAEELARTAVDMVLTPRRQTSRPTRSRNSPTYCASCRKAEEAKQVIGQAIDLYAQKGNIVSANRHRAWLQALAVT